MMIMNSLASTASRTVAKAAASSATLNLNVARVAMKAGASSQSHSLSAVHADSLSGSPAAPFHTAAATPTMMAASGPVGPSQEFLDAAAKLGSPNDLASHVLMSNHDAKGRVGKCPFTSTKPELQRAAERETNARTYVRKFPFVVAKGEGIMLTDTDGREYYDCLGCAGTLALGHNHPVVVDAIQKFLASGAPLQALDMATPEKDAFMTSLASVIPAELSRMHFCSPAGTDALDAAVKLCKTYTGRRSVLSFHGGYHGHGHGTLAMMGNLGAKTPITGLMPEVYFLPYPYTHRNPFGIPGEEGEAAVLRYIENMLSDDESGIPAPACVVMEAIQGEGGVNAISPHALREIRRITAEHGIPLIMDEVQAGFCRSGDFFAYQESGIVPDVLCMSKAVGGTMPLAVIAYKDEMDVWGPGAHTGTFRGNQLSFACGTASIEFMKETKLWEQVREKSTRLLGHLETLQAKFPEIGHIRGRGLMIGLEMVNPDAPADKYGLPPRDGTLSAAIQVECFKRGLILEKGGRHGSVIRFLAPLIISMDEIDICAGIFAEAVEAAVTDARSRR